MNIFVVNILQNWLGEKYESHKYFSTYEQARDYAVERALDKQSDDDMMEPATYTYSITVVELDKPESVGTTVYLFFKVEDPRYMELYGTDMAESYPHGMECKEAYLVNEEMKAEIHRAIYNHNHKQLEERTSRRRRTRV